jgi:hypothetical protein
MKIIKYKYLTLLLLTLFAFNSCDTDITLIGDPVKELSNDCIKRSLAIFPNIVGNDLEFTYAMAIPPALGKLSSVQVTATIAGAQGTFLNPNSYYTNNAGIDVPVLVAAESTTSGGTTSTTFTKDTCAATLRYFYIIPEEARGKEVSFTFSVKASNGQTAEYKMGPYAISKMDMTLKKVLTSKNNCYISFRGAEAITIYSEAEIAANSSLASQIDLVYTYHTNEDLNHCFYAADAPQNIRPGLTFPSGFSNNTRVIKMNLRDRQLTDLATSNIIDDLDFQVLSFDRGSSSVIRILAEGGLWIETADKQYRAYIYMNTVAANTATISVKRYKM